MTSRASLARLLPRLHRRCFTSGPSLPVVEHSNIERSLAGTQQNRYAVKLMSKANTRQFLPCVTIAAEMKEKGVEPNPAIYNSMLFAAAEDGLWLDALAIFDDMLNMDVQPNTMSFNHLLHVSREVKCPDSSLCMKYRPYDLDRVIMSQRCWKRWRRVASDRTLKLSLQSSRVASPKAI